MYIGSLTSTNVHGRSGCQCLSTVESSRARHCGTIIVRTPPRNTIICVPPFLYAFCWPLLQSGLLGRRQRRTKYTWPTPTTSHRALLFWAKQATMRTRIMNLFSPHYWMCIKRPVFFWGNPPPLLWAKKAQRPQPSRRKKLWFGRGRPSSRKKTLRFVRGQNKKLKRAKWNASSTHATTLPNTRTWGARLATTKPNWWNTTYITEWRRAAPLVVIKCRHANSTQTCTGACTRTSNGIGITELTPATQHSTTNAMGWKKDVPFASATRRRLSRP